MSLFEKEKPAQQQQEKEQRKGMKNETDSVRAGDFWLLLFVSIVILLFVFRFYS